MRGWALLGSGMLTLLLVAVALWPGALPAPAPTPTSTAAALARLSEPATAAASATATSSPTPTATATATATISSPTPTFTATAAPTRAAPPSRGQEQRPLAPPPTATARPAPPAPPTPPPAPTFSAEQAFSLDLLNGARAAAGLPPLRLDAQIGVAAQGHAEEMARYGYLAHVNRQGQQPWDRLRAAGVQFGYAAENLGRAWAGDGPAQPAIQAMHDTMMAETPPNDGHRTNVLSPRLKRVGIGLARANGWLYWVCDFAD